MRRLSWPVWGVLAGLLAWSTPASATIVPARSLDRMVLDASRIVRGKVSTKRTFWGKAKRYIYTEITLKVVATLKGTAGTTLRIHVPGGQMGQRIMRIAGTSEFRIGEEVVVFLEPKRHPTYQFILGMTSGKYQVQQKNGAVYLHRSLHGLSFQKSVGLANGQPVHMGHQSEPGLRWLHLQTRVKAMARLTSLKKIRVIQPKPHLVHQKYIFLLRLHKMKARVKALRQTRPQFGVMLPRTPRPSIGTLPHHSLPKTRTTPVARPAKGGK